MAQGGTLATSLEEDRDVGGLSYACCKQVSPATTWRPPPRAGDRVFIFLAVDLQRIGQFVQTGLQLTRLVTTTVVKISNLCVLYSRIAPIMVHILLGFN